MTARSNRRSGLLVAGATALGVAGTAFLATARAQPPVTGTIAVTSSTSIPAGPAGAAAAGDGPDEPAPPERRGRDRPDTVIPPAVQPARPVPARPRYTG
jgi:hypothetical protein